MTKPVIMISFFNELNLLISITFCIVTVTFTSLAVREFRTILRGCSYGGELARLGGLARLVEISPSLRNSYKNIMCSYEK